MTVTKPAPRTPVQRKRDQRQRDRAALFGADVPLEAVKTSALAEALPTLLAADAPLTLARVLCELGRRGGVTVTASPAGNRSVTVTNTPQRMRAPT